MEIYWWSQEKIKNFYRTFSYFQITDLITGKDKLDMRFNVEKACF